MLRAAALWHLEPDADAGVHGRRRLERTRTGSRPRSGTPGVGRPGAPLRPAMVGAQRSGSPEQATQRVGLHVVWSPSCRWVTPGRRSSGAHGIVLNQRMPWPTPLPGDSLTSGFARVLRSMRRWVVARPSCVRSRLLRHAAPCTPLRGQHPMHGFPLAAGVPDPDAVDAGVVARGVDRLLDPSRTRAVRCDRARRADRVVRAVLTGGSGHTWRWALLSTCLGS